MICFDFFLGKTWISFNIAAQDVFNLHSQRTVQYSEQKNRPVQTSEILNFL